MISFWMFRLTSEGESLFLVKGNWVVSSGETHRKAGDRMVRLIVQDDYKGDGSYWCVRGGRRVLWRSSCGEERKERVLYSRTFVWRDG